MADQEKTENIKLFCASINDQLLVSITALVRSKMLIEHKTVFESWLK